MTSFGKAAARLLAALLLTGSLGTGAFAAFGDMGPYEDVGSPFGGSGLKLEGGEKIDAPPAPSTAAPSAELTSFWEKLRTGTIEPACRKAEVKLKQNVKIVEGVAGLEGSVKRAIRKFPDGKLALVDEIGLSQTISYGKNLLSLPQIESLAISVGASGNLSGKSQVVRPIANKNFCMDALEIAKFWEFKTVLPGTVKRVKKMEVGEIWKLPLSMSMSFSAGASANIQQVVNVSVSYGHSRTTRPSITLRRLEQNKLRLRVRLDRIRVNSVGVGASTVEIPLDALGLEKAGTLTADLLNKYAVPKFAEKWVTPEIFDKLLKSEINKYLAFKMSFGHSRYSGKKLLLEYVLDPENEGHMAALQEFLRGDFGMLDDLTKLGVKFNKFNADDDAEYGLNALTEAAGAIEDPAAGEEGREGEAPINTFSGTDIYNGRSNSFGANIPLVGDHSVSWGSSYHRYQSSNSGGETLHVHQRTRSYSGSNINIPFMGTLIRNNSQRDVLVLNNESTTGEVTKPVLLYQQMDGFVNRGNGAAENLVEKANSMLRYVGMNGKGTSDAAFVPMSDMAQESRRYKSAVMSVKLLINDGGVQDILGAPAEAVMKAFMNVMREAYAEIIDKVQHLFYINKKGKVDYNRNAAAAILQLSPEDLNDSMNPLNVIDSLVWSATAFLKDLTSVREAGGWKEQSKRLADVAAGKGKGDMKYEDFFKVVLQLVKPSDVSAQVYVYMDPKKKGTPDVVKSYDFYNSGKTYDATLQGVTEMRERFADPSELSD